MVGGENSRERKRSRGNTKVRARGAPRQSRYLPQAVDDSTLDQTDPRDSTAAPREPTLQQREGVRSKEKQRTLTD